MRLSRPLTAPILIPTKLSPNNSCAPYNAPDSDLFCLMNGDIWTAENSAWTAPNDRKTPSFHSICRNTKAHKSCSPAITSAAAHPANTPCGHSWTTDSAPLSPPVLAIFFIIMPPKTACWRCNSPPPTLIRFLPCAPNNRRSYMWIWRHKPLPLPTVILLFLILPPTTKADCWAAWTTSRSPCATKTKSNNMKLGDAPKNRGCMNNP